MTMWEKAHILLINRISLLVAPSAVNQQVEEILMSILENVALLTPKQFLHLHSGLVLGQNDPMTMTTIKMRGLMLGEGDMLMTHSSYSSYSQRTSKTVSTLTSVSVRPSHSKKAIVGTTNTLRSVSLYNMTAPTFLPNTGRMLSFMTMSTLIKSLPAITLLKPPICKLRH